MKKLFLCLFLLVSIVTGADNSVTVYNVWEDRTLAADDTIKSTWIPIYDSKVFNAFIDFTAFGKTDTVSLYYWLHPGELSSPNTDTTTAGYIRSDKSSYMLAKQFIYTDYANNSGKFYHSLHYPPASAISLSRYIQFIIETKTETDSTELNFYFLKQD